MAWCLVKHTSSTSHNRFFVYLVFVSIFFPFQYIPQLFLVCCSLLSAFLIRIYQFFLSTSLEISIPVSVSVVFHLHGYIIHEVFPVFFSPEMRPALLFCFFKWLTILLHIRDVLEFGCPELL